MAIVFAIQSGVPGGDFFSGTAVNFGIPWVVLTITFNILVTGMISVRLISLQKKVYSAFGLDRTIPSVGLVAILVESALPFTLLGIAFLVTYAMNNPTSLAFIGIWGCFCVSFRFSKVAEQFLIGSVQSLSPQAIILRVAMGSAWTKETVWRVTGTHVFDPESSTTRQADDEKFDELGVDADSTQSNMASRTG